MQVRARKNLRYFNPDPSTKGGAEGQLVRKGLTAAVVMAVESWLKVAGCLLSRMTPGSGPASWEWVQVQVQVQMQMQVREQEKGGLADRSDKSS